MAATACACVARMCNRCRSRRRESCRSQPRRWQMSVWRARRSAAPGVAPTRATPPTQTTRARAQARTRVVRAAQAAPRKARERPDRRAGRARLAAEVRAGGRHRAAGPEGLTSAGPACMVGEFPGGVSVSRPLTERQQAILDFIVATIRTRGFPPTLREIGRDFGIRSTKGVNDHLEALERKGKIRRQKDLSRAIEVVDMVTQTDHAVSIPVVGRIAAGAPLLATENVEGNLVVDESLVHGARNFLLRIQGDSMVRAHICDGDLVLIRPQDTADAGEIVAALVDDEATVKRFYQDADGVRLVPENETMPPIVVPPETPVRILGKVVAVLRSL